MENEETRLLDAEITAFDGSDPAVLKIHVRVYRDGAWEDEIVFLSPGQLVKAKVRRFTDESAFGFTMLVSQVLELNELGGS